MLPKTMAIKKIDKVRKKPVRVKKHKVKQQIDKYRYIYEKLLRLEMLKRVMVISAFSIAIASIGIAISLDTFSWSSVFSLLAVLTGYAVTWQQSYIIGQELQKLALMILEDDINIKYMFLKDKGVLGKFLNEFKKEFVETDYTPIM